jgi:hypothetical protein
MSNLVVEIKNRYQYLDGKLFHKNHRYSTYEGKEAGSIYVCTKEPFNSYRKLNMGGTFIPAHHAIWMMFNGYIPKYTQVAHINGNTLDNRIENLTLV